MNDVDAVITRALENAGLRAGDSLGVATLLVPEPSAVEVGDGAAADD